MEKIINDSRFDHLLYRVTYVEQQMILEYTLHWLQQIRAQWQAMLQQLLRGGKQRICVLRLQQLGQQRNGFRVACAIEREKCGER